MIKWNVPLAVILLLSITVLVAQSVSAKEEAMSVGNVSLNASSNNTELVSFVESAMAYAQKKW